MSEFLVLLARERFHVSSTLPFLGPDDADAALPRNLMGPYERVLTLSGALSTPPSFSHVLTAAAAAAAVDGKLQQSYLLIIIY